ncbi:alpha/beta fold hydrolase [Aeromicrobium endophyticum]|uniref:Alpha/beta fold hydrolase n=1 Tax=Aeromicrobium endophyticum TaxID=2292704 RepID=A0A371PC53_9ACTN|nr:alpha/beta hydrolase [Aeromicrobium endophyticum]REK73521.1 alpha/beta fold hydrolase [Aeromicrobium endophyticum]
MTRSTSVSVAGTALHVDDTAESDLTPVVCLHSLFFDNRMFDDLVEAGAGRYRFVRPEYRGQGRSGPADGAVVTIEQCAGDIAAVLDELQIAGAPVIASSMGGDVAARLAVYRPDLVGSLIFLGSSVRPEPADKVAEYVAWSDDVGEHGFTGDRLTMVEQIMFGASTRSDPAKADVLDRWRGRMAALPTSIRPAMIGVMRRRSAVDALGEIDVPALVISGEECPVRPPEWAYELADGLPRGELVMLPRVGHSPLLEAPDTVIPRILDFLDAQS